ncbi:glycosyltransferase [Synechococcus sp. PCC 7336]|uniref:glycosyltransferase n=1 Tax=Synechococcus sp. PCC 7336 TaxID=195250 RepID=UPI00034DB9F9|nr:glycosyltransferase [Synechococcus sp. PCC 7336]
MRILFLHPNFPAQFRHLAMALRQNPEHQVVFGTTQPVGQLKGVTKVLYRPSREVSAETHHYTRNLESAVLQGQAVARLIQDLAKKGFVPDVVYGHSGWGPTLYIKDLLPKTRLLCYFEWFYRARGTDADFDPDDPLDLNDMARIRTKNAAISIDLLSCDAGLCPTQWQRQQFPLELQGKLGVMHDGVDTAYFKPDPKAKLVLPDIGLDLSEAAEIVTYVARGMEPYRGFPQFIETVHLLLQRRPHCHIVIVGEDRVAYGKQRQDGKTYKQAMLEQFPLDPERTHFTDRLPYSDYLKVLQASDAHIYLTRPFVLSWSMLEAMSVGCLLVASGTPPVLEVLQDNVNGLLVDFFSPEQIADRVEEALDNRDRMAEIRNNARETILQNYNLATLLPRHLEWLLLPYGG